MISLFLRNIFRNLFFLLNIFLYNDNEFIEPPLAEIVHEKNEDEIQSKKNIFLVYGGKKKNTKMNEIVNRIFENLLKDMDNHLPSMRIVFFRGTVLVVGTGTSQDYGKVLLSIMQNSTEQNIIFEIREDITHNKTDVLTLNERTNLENNLIGEMFQGLRRGKDFEITSYNHRIYVILKNTPSILEKKELIQQKIPKSNFSSYEFLFFLSK